MKAYKTREESERAHQADMKFLNAMAEVKSNSTQEPSELQKARARLRKTLSGRDEPLVSEDDLRAAAERFSKAKEDRGGPELQAARRRLRATLSGRPEEPKSEPVKEDAAALEPWQKMLLQEARKAQLAEARRKLRETLSQRQLNEERL